MLRWFVVLWGKIDKWLHYTMLDRSVSLEIAALSRVYVCLLAACVGAQCT